ncbi:MAG: hypothetical protein N2652_03045 [Kiritimatiellae bacterium]|nr:hypothetical protein [Kiritimatiellia bacterium]
MHRALVQLLVALGLAGRLAGGGDDRVGRPSPNVRIVVADDLG